MGLSPRPAHEGGSTGAGPILPRLLGSRASHHLERGARDPHPHPRDHRRAALRRANAIGPFIAAPSPTAAPRRDHQAAREARRRHRRQHPPTFRRRELSRRPWPCDKSIHRIHLGPAPTHPSIILTRHLGIPGRGSVEHLQHCRDADLFRSSSVRGPRK